MSEAGPTRAYVLHPDLKSDRGRRTPELALAEAVSLAAALPSLTVAGAEVVRVPRVAPGMLFGSGKVAELKARMQAEEVGLVLVDGPVSPVQQRNLEKEWGCKLLDRTGLILEIFADRARTREGVLQVELAALSYQRTRLVRAWTHLERQRGGFGFVGGPGETQIEADRRAIDDQVVKLKRQLEKVVKTRELHRAARRKVPFPVVALVGYTNAGKSTLFNRMTGAEVLAKDMLFATLDPTMRGVVLPSGRKVILSDTVGFISDLPTQLVAAFRATLEEVLEANIILHVRDMSDPDNGAQAGDVNRILEDLGIDDKDRAERIIEVWNKIDRLEPEAAEALTQKAAAMSNTLAVSAVTGEGIDALLEEVQTRLSGVMTETTVILPPEKMKLLPWIYGNAIVDEREDLEDGSVRLDLRLTESQALELDGRLGNIRPQPEW